MKKPCWLLSLACAAALLSGCGTSQRDPIEVRNARSPATPPGSSVAAVYAEVVARNPDTLLGASTPVARQVDMHETREEGGMMQMRPLEHVELKPGQPARFEPGGMHMMLMDLQETLPPGAHFALTLHFEKAGDVPVTVAVLAPGATP